MKASESRSTSKKTAPAKPTKTTQKPTQTQKVEKAVATTPKSERANPFVRMGAYFKGAWTELRLVRWPDRKSTWGMTGALILFTLFFVVVILLLDYAFSLLFKPILGS